MHATTTTCPYRAKNCPGSSEEAYVAHDECIWSLLQATCARCEGDWYIANPPPNDDEEYDRIAAGEDDDEDTITEAEEELF